MKRFPLVLLLAASCAGPGRASPPDIRHLREPIKITGISRVVDFAGAELVGSPDGTAPDAFAGTALLVEGGRDITIRNVRIRGFKVAIHAIGVERLTIEDCDLSGNWRQRLHSTPDAEAPEDWLYGHRNDDNEWLKHGAAIYLERCAGAVIRQNVGRHGQNGVCLVRSNGARIYDNDFSFNSGWGLAMYRSSRATVSRNKFDWCIRGYSHGVYSRGQDSAGILVYEQCSDNFFAYNSATHGGDGFFLWAGHETLDKTGEGGCNNNLLYRNDFSHAAANGIEATFSVGNQFIENRLEECDHGIWAGYSSQTRIQGNFIARCANGVSIEHGQDNDIRDNTFEENGVSINLWWDEDPDLFKTAYGTKRNLKSERYGITGNTFRDDKVAIQLRETSDLRIKGNNFIKGKAIFNGADSDVYHRVQDNNIGEYAQVNSGPGYVRLGLNWWKTPPGDVDLLEHPVEVNPATWGAPPKEYGTLNAFLPVGVPRGRKHIFVDEWGPRDPSDPKIAEERARQAVDLAKGWKLAFHKWDSAGAGKPPANWDAVKASAPLEIEQADRLDFRWPDQPVKSVPADYFATIATTAVELEAGDYDVITVSDDGIRVAVDGKVVIEDWTWHGPTTHTAKVTLAKGKHALRVEHFEIDGFAQLSVRLRPAR